MFHRRAGLLVCVLAVAALGCSNPPASGLDAGPAKGADTGVPVTGNYDITTLDPSASGDYPLSLAISGNKIAVAYWVDIPDAGSKTVTTTTDGGTATTTLTEHELRYVEKDQSPEVIGQFYNVYGGSLALDSKGQPYVAFLGPPGNLGSKWVESCTTVVTRPGAVGTAWTAPPDVAATVNDQVVGLWASIAVDSHDKLYLGYRNVHFGQFPNQDWGHSNVEMVNGQLGAWSTTGVGCAKVGDCPAFGGDSLLGYGAYLSIAMANDLPAFAWSAMPSAAMGQASDVYFTMMNADGTWPVDPHKVKASDNTATGLNSSSPGGPQLAWMKSYGFMIAYDDHKAGQLWILQSKDGSDWSKAPYPVTGSGTAGWFPSAAFTPDGYPAVAYYVCSDSPGASYCPPAQDELDVSWVIDDQLETETADPEGGHWGRLAYWNQQAVVAYRDVNHTVLKLAVRK
jgi:hypothetical protein